MTARALDDCARNRLAVTRPGVGPATSLVTACSLGRGVGVLDGVAGTVRRPLMLPAIAATLG